MAKISRIKKRLVSDAIHENVDIIKGRLPRNLNPRLPIYRALARATLLAVGGGALLIGSLLVAKATREVPIAVPFAVSGSQALSAEVATLERFDAPGKIDPRVFPLGVRRVVLDPGHGGRHGGTVVGDLHESDITLDIAHRLRELLEADGLDVVMTRRHDTEVELADRVTFANQNRGDVFVSIHVNWLVTRAVRGVETYYLGPTDDPFLTQLTSEENQGSGY